MSLRVGYFTRTDRGDRPESVRLIGLRADEAWTASPEQNGFSPALHVTEQCDSAARWTVDRLREAKSRRLDVLCIDTCGAISSWLTTPARGSSVVQAAYVQSGGLGLSRATGDEGALSEVDPTLQALAPTGATAEAGNQRVGVIAQHDACVNLYIDRLDRAGVRVPCVISLWQALALAWDPAAHPSPGLQVRAGDSTITAIALVDPAGRIAWAWSRAGEPVAAGSLVTRSAASETSSGILRGTTARLTSDWLSWAAQIGRAPERIVVITPPLSGGSASEVSHSGFGEALASMWPDAPLTMAVHDDPVGATLARLIDSDSLHDAGAPASPKSISPLTHRPSLAHRSMYVWAGVALVSLSAALMAMSVRWLMAKDRLGQERLQLQNEASDYAREYDPKLAQSMFMSREIEAMIAQRVGGSARTDFQAEQPVLQELATITGVLSGFVSGEPEDTFKINEIRVASQAVYVKCVVPNSQFGESLCEYLRDDATNSNVIWNQPRFFQNQNLEVTLDGFWKERAATGENP